MRYQKMADRSTKTTVFHFGAGLTTGCMSATLLQPVDLLKTRVQQSHSASLITTFRNVLANPNPLRQLWRGTLPSVIRSGIGSALFYSTLNSLRQHVVSSNLLTSSGLVESPNVKPNFSSSSLPRLSNTANLSTGAIARASVGFIMMPITVIKVRYESTLYSYKSTLEAGTAIFRGEGIRGLFSGFGATAIRDAPYAGLYVLFYEQSKGYLSQLREAGALSTDAMQCSTSMYINFSSGVLAAGFATGITNPFDAIKTRVQLIPSKYGNMFMAARRMIREDGLRSLFDGLGLRMGRKALSSALAWTLYEEFIRQAETGLQREPQAVA